MAAAAFPVLPECAARRAEAAEALVRELGAQTFADGINRELATDYHAFVAELAMAAFAEGEIAGAPFPDSAWQPLAAMLDAAAALLDATGRPPRQGDGDDGLGFPVDPPAEPAERWASLLAAGEALVGRRPWWPKPLPRDARAACLAALVPPRGIVGRPARRPNVFANAGLVLMRDPAPRPDEIWCRLDHGPHGFLATAAHGHADALSVELRHGGIDVLADPGTYCYHGERAWRRYFRSTLGHSTLELDGQDQALDGGPFLWLGAPASRLIELHGLDGGPRATWVAVHDGYARLRPPAEHRRSVRLDREARAVEIEDRVTGAGSHRARLAFHLGPGVDCRLDGAVAHLAWSGPAGAWRALVELPADLAWTAHRGESDPPLGWYAARFGHKEPATTLVGAGVVQPGSALVTRLAILPADPSRGERAACADAP